jgi:hypothetical protein
MLKKINIVILYCFFFYRYAAADVNSVVISEEQISRFVSASWKEPPRSIDITFYKEIAAPPKSAEEIREQVESVFDTEKHDQKTKEMIEKNVAKRLSSQKFPRLLKERIRISGYKQRIDQVKAESGGKIEPNMSYNMTYVNSNEPNTSKHVSFHIIHDSKTAWYDKQKWANRDPGSFTVLPLGVSSLFQTGLGINIGTQNAPFYAPDQDKIGKFKQTGILLDTFRVTITPDPNGLDTKDLIEINPLENKGSKTKMICDRNDYSRVYYSEFQLVPAGQVIYIRECNDYDLKGFPHYVSEIQYDLDGQFKEKSVYTVTEVQLNPIIPDEVFALNVPSDYGIYAAVEPNNTVRTIREKGFDIDMKKLLKARKENDKETLKDFLGHESWKIRLLSLQSLNFILIKQDPHELKELATIFENDDNPKVRGEAQNILKYIKTKESSNLNSKGTFVPVAEPNNPP